MREMQVLGSLVQVFTTDLLWLVSRGTYYTFGLINEYILTRRKHHSEFKISSIHPMSLQPISGLLSWGSVTAVF
jgi:hypothetical protein